MPTSLIRGGMGGGGVVVNVNDDVDCDGVFGGRGGRGGVLSSGGGGENGENTGWVGELGGSCLSAVVTDEVLAETEPG